MTKFEKVTFEKQFTRRIYSIDETPASFTVDFSVVKLAKNRPLYPGCPVYSYVNGERVVFTGKPTRESHESNDEYESRYELNIDFADGDNEMFAGYFDSVEDCIKEATHIVSNWWNLHTDIW